MACEVPFDRIRTGCSDCIAVGRGFRLVRSDHHDRRSELPELAAMLVRRRCHRRADTAATRAGAPRSSRRPAHDFLSKPDRDVRDDNMGSILQSGVVRGKGAEREGGC